MVAADSPAAADSVATDQEGISILQAAVALLRRRHLVIRITAVIVALTIVLTLLGSRTHTSRFSFIPQSDAEGISRLAGLASQFGVAVPTGDAGQTPEFYVALIQSPTVHNALADTIFEFVHTEGLPFFRDTVRFRGTLAEVYDIERSSPELTRHYVLERLRRDIRPSSSTSTGVVTVSVSSPNPQLSLAMAEAVLREVDRFNQQVRQSRAASERDFLESRLDEAQSELRDSENRLEDFLRDNRTFSTSPALVFQHDRLNRIVTLRQQVVLGLTQSYEQSRVEEVRNTPVITAVELPIAPARPDRRRLVLKTFASAFVGFGIAAIIALVLELTMGTGSGRERAEFAALRREAVAELRGYWPRVRRDRPK
jgi:uncharacterized protein involved in exopolysaccharide biosynthesis